MYLSLLTVHPQRQKQCHKPQRLVTRTSCQAPTPRKGKQTVPFSIFYDDIKLSCNLCFSKSAFHEVFFTDNPFCRALRLVVPLSYKYLHHKFSTRRAQHQTCAHNFFNFSHFTIQNRQILPIKPLKLLINVNRQKVFHKTFCKCQKRLYLCTSFHGISF